MLVLINQWQTLIAGLIAIVAALIGGGFVNKQIRQTETIERERLRRSSAAARAIMPLTLSAVSGYAEEAGAALRHLYDQMRDDRVPTNASVPDFPLIPAHALPQLQDLIKTSDEEVGNRVSDILSQIQLLASRLSALRSDISSPTTIVIRRNIIDFVINAAEIHAHCSSLFRYARRETDVVSEPLGHDQLIGSVRIIGFRDDRYSDIATLIQERANRRGR